MPPGLQEGVKDIETQWSDALVDLGYWVLHWDPRGRGSSTGQEVANGPEGASDAAALLRWASALPNVDSHIELPYCRGLLAVLWRRVHWHSTLIWGPIYGSTMRPLAGCLRTFSMSKVDLGNNSKQWRSMSCGGTNALQPIGRQYLGIPYVRLQGLPDHAQGPRFEHAQDSA